MAISLVQPMKSELFKKVLEVSHHFLKSFEFMENVGFANFFHRFELQNFHQKVGEPTFSENP